MSDLYMDQLNVAAVTEGAWMRRLTTLLASYPAFTVIDCVNSGLCQKLPCVDDGDESGEYRWRDLWGRNFTDVELADTIGPYNFQVGSFTEVDW